MTRRFPLWPTLIVVAAALLMVRLGVWQLQRRAEKEALIARHAANLSLPPVALPALLPLTEAGLFRRTSATCLRVTGWQTEAGRAKDGATGWRHIALCATGAEGRGFAADMGVSQSPQRPAYRGGRVAGQLSVRPTSLPLVARLFAGPVPLDPMIVAEAPAPGLVASAPPDPASATNNHLSYAVQWFVFAALAPAIYLLALRRRWRLVARDGGRR